MINYMRAQFRICRQHSGSKTAGCTAVVIGYCAQCENRQNGS